MNRKDNQGGGGEKREGGEASSSRSWAIAQDQRSGFGKREANWEGRDESVHMQSEYERGSLGGSEMVEHDASRTACPARFVHLSGTNGRAGRTRGFG